MHDPPRMQIVKPQEALQQAAPDDFLAEVFAMIQFIALYISASRSETPIFLFFGMNGLRKSCVISMLHHQA